MRPLFLAAALLVALPASAQDVSPDPQSTYVLPAHRGEMVRVTTHDQRPTQFGRLAERYRGLRANRTVHATERYVTKPQPAAPTFDTPRHAFVRRGGSFFQVLPAR